MAVRPTSTNEIGPQITFGTEVPSQNEDQAYIDGESDERRHGDDPARPLREPVETAGRGLGGRGRHHRCILSSGNVVS